MGVVHNENAHVKRSSSMPFALRWKHENVRMFTFVSLFTVTVTVMFFLLLNAAAAKDVALVVDGKETVLTTKLDTLHELLEKEAIPVGEHDKVSLALDAKLKHGTTITIDHASAFTLKADGKTQTLYTVKETVAEALKDSNIAVGALDKVTPSLTSQLTENASVQIVRVKKEQKVEEVPIAFKTVTQQDANLLKGKQKTLQEGKKGTKTITKELVYEDGVLVSEKVLGEAVAAASVNKIVAVGSKNPVVALAAVKETVKTTAVKKTTTVKKTTAQASTVTKDGVPFTYKRILNNVTLTAYSAGPASTGKSKGEDGYGITRSGTVVTEGRTIAVDPDVIPLGWWVYIEGVGYRRAEDTGSAVQGNKIDVYYDSEAFAQKFGLKRGYTVYVIGPKKPTED